MARWRRDLLEYARWWWGDETVPTTTRIFATARKVEALYEHREQVRIGAISTKADVAESLAWDGTVVR